jgi:hypothetical protein
VANDHSHPCSAVNDGGFLVGDSDTMSFVTSLLANADRAAEMAREVDISD